VDHSYVEEMVQAGRIDRETARTLPDKNIITRAVGAEDDLTVDFFREDLTDGELLLLCSDGLTNMLTDEEIVRIVFSYRNLEDAADRLIYEANMAGGQDNISAILVNPFEAYSLNR
jgi:protein phosphatase